MESYGNQLIVIKSSKISNDICQHWVTINNEDQVNCQLRQSIGLITPLQ